MAASDIQAIDLATEVYEQRSITWEDARSQTVEWLKRECKKALEGERDADRLHVEPGRVKDPKRAAAKLDKKLRETRAEPDAALVEELIRDIVGTKVLCKSTRDQEIITKHLLTVCSEGSPSLTRDPALYTDMEAMEDYEVAGPKLSGYRGNHLIVRFDVAGEEPVAVEVQIKTRLQDAWGELTHESSYKPGAAITSRTSFHDEVAKTMANLLAEVDRLADRLAEDMEGHVEAVASAESSIENVADAVDEKDEESGGPESVSVTVTFVNDRYALAEDENGRRGLIRAADIRTLAGETGLIDVDDYLEVKDELEVTVVESGEDRFYDPHALPADRD